jgi:hypothetical protein
MADINTLSKILKTTTKILLDVSKHLEKLKKTTGPLPIPKKQSEEKPTSSSNEQLSDAN